MKNEDRTRKRGKLLSVQAGQRPLTFRNPHHAKRSELMGCLFFNAVVFPPPSLALGVKEMFRKKQLTATKPFGH